MNMMIKSAVTLWAVAFAGQAVATEWDVSLWGKRRAFTEHVEKLAELVEAKTGGAFRLNLRYGPLGRRLGNLEAIAAGRVEMAQFCVGYHPSKTPSLTVLELPFLGVQTLEQEIAVSRAVYDHPATVADLARWNATLLMPSPLPQYNVVGVGEPPKRVFDLGGMSVRATGGVAQSMEVLRAEAVAMPAGQVPDALAMGRLNGIAFAPHALISFGILEQADWATTNLNPGTIHCPVVANSEALAALPDAHRAALLASLDEALDHYVGHYRSETLAQWDRIVEDRHIEPVTFSDTALDLLSVLSERLSIRPWLEDMAAKGLPGESLLAVVRAAVHGPGPQPRKG